MRRKFMAKGMFFKRSVVKSHSHLGSMSSSEVGNKAFSPKQCVINNLSRKRAINSSFFTNQVVSCIVGNNLTPCFMINIKVTLITIIILSKGGKTKKDVVMALPTDQATKKMGITGGSSLKNSYEGSSSPGASNR